jgi:hypothetical protein
MNTTNLITRIVFAILTPSIGILIFQQLWIETGNNFYFLGIIFLAILETYLLLSLINELVRRITGFNCFKWIKKNLN